MTSSMPAGLTARHATLDDARAVGALPGLAASTRRVLAAQLGDAPDRAAEVAVDQDGTVVGFALWWRAPDATHLLDLVVALSQRRRGIATALVRRGLDAAPRYGHDHVTLEVRADQPGARRLYASLGFVEVGSRPGYYPADDVGPAADAVIAWWPDAPAELPRQEATATC